MPVDLLVTSDWTGVQIPASLRGGSVHQSLVAGTMTKGPPPANAEGTTAHPFRFTRAGSTPLLACAQTENAVPGSRGRARVVSSLLSPGLIPSGNARRTTGRRTLRGGAGATRAVPVRTRPGATRWRNTRVLRPLVPETCDTNGKKTMEKVVLEPVTGADLKNWGHRPGKQFPDLLARANAMRAEGYGQIGRAHV